MFSTLQVDTLQELQIRDARDESQTVISTITGKPKRLRLRKGCTFCRTRKKKCDEQKPVCGLCTAKKVECHYVSASGQTLSLPQDRRARETTPADSLLSLSPGSEVFLRHLVSDLLHLLSHEPLPTLPHEPLRTLHKIEEVDDCGEPLRSPETLDKLASWSMPVLIEPSHQFLLILDTESLRFVDYFLQDGIPSVSILPQTQQNHFANTCMAVAVRDEGMVWLLAAWGALFLEGPTSAVFERNLQRALRYTEKKLTLSNLSDIEWFNLMFFYLQAASVSICAGDTSVWYEMFSRCGDMLHRFGSIENLLRKFNYDFEAKWFVSNLQYNDVTSSVSLKYGTLLDMSEYSVLFEDETDYSYGIDPLQGIMHPILLLLGEIMNANSAIQRERLETERALAATKRSDTVQWDILTKRQMQGYINALAQASGLMEKLNVCEPKSNQQCFIPAEDLEDHLTLFEAFRNTCKLYILVYIQGMQIRAPEVQLVLMDTFKLVDLLIASKLRAAISLVLLTAGQCCCYQADRDEMKLKFSRLLQHYKVYNVGKVQHIVEQCWAANPKGKINVDWVDLCENIGWKLSAS